MRFFFSVRSFAFSLVSIFFLLGACSDSPEPLAGQVYESIEGNVPAARKGTSSRSGTPKAAQNRRSKVRNGNAAGAAPPRQNGVAVRSRQRNRNIAIEQNIRIEERDNGATLEASMGGLGVKMKVQIPHDDVETDHHQVKARRRGTGTCKSELLAKGHSASSLVFCDDANARCAVALLRAGHPPSSLVHCEDIKDVNCAVQLLRSGRRPSQIVHCD